MEFSEKEKATLLAALEMWANTGSRLRQPETRKHCGDLGALSREEALALHQRIQGDVDVEHEDEGVAAQGR